MNNEKAYFFSAAKFAEKGSPAPIVLQTPLLSRGRARLLPYRALDSAPRRAYRIRAMNAITPCTPPCRICSPVKVLVVLAALWCACLPYGADALAATRATDPAPVSDPFPAVVQKAMKRAGRSYKPVEFQAPEYLRELSEMQWRGIRFKPEHAVWRQKNLPFEIELHHPGFLYHAVVVNVVDDDGIRRLPFSADMFAYDNKVLAEKAKQNPPGFAGFRVMFPLNSQYSRDAVASFLGASHFRAVGKHSRFGANARALAVNTALPDGEEFPFFREFWIVAPKQRDAGLVVCALMESPGMTGAFRFTITPGASTVMDVESRLFPRKKAGWPLKVGLAPLAGMFLYSETTNGASNDYRPEVHNADGLLFSAGENSWTWRPLANPNRLAVNTFPMADPRGFGLMQRDNAFDHYQDIEARFDKSPSIWVEPQSDWGTGKIELIEIPSSEEIHQNAIAFWVPDASPPESDDAKALSFAYRLYWMTPGVTPHALGRVTATRIIRDQRNDTVRFFIDFESESLKRLPADTGLTSLIEAPENAPIIDKRLVKNPATGGWRLIFCAKLTRQDGVVQSFISARDGSPRLRFRALLKKGENLPDPLTEEWVYDLPS